MAVGVFTMVYQTRFLLSCLIVLQCIGTTFSLEPSRRSDVARDVTLTLTTADGRSSFRIGELIPLKLAFNSAVHGKYQVDLATYDRSGRMTEESFLIRPASGWVDPLESWFSAGPAGGKEGAYLSADPALSRSAPREVAWRSVTGWAA